MAMISQQRVGGGQAMRGAARQQTKLHFNTTSLNKRGSSQLCRFQPSSQRSIEDITSTSSREFVDNNTTRKGPLAVCLDHNVDSAEAVKWTLTNLTYAGMSLQEGLNSI